MLGYVRVAAAVPGLEVGNCDYNTKEILNLIEKAQKQNVKVIVFPELCITGYTCADLFFQSTLIKSAEDALCYLLEATKNVDMVIVTGLPIHVKNQIFNCAAISHKGRLLGIVPKTYLPNSGEFYEKRWFSPAYNINSETIFFCGQTVSMGNDLLFDCIGQGLVIGVEICQDVWEPIPPSSYQALAGANLILNLSASNEIFSKQNTRRLVVTGHSSRTVSAYVYASAGIWESTTDLVFSGHSFICENGAMLNESKRFEKDPYIIVSDLDLELIMKERQKNNGFTACLNNGGEKNYRFINVDLALTDPNKLMRKALKNPYLPDDAVSRSKCCEDIFNIQAIGLSKRLRHTNINKSIIAVSGGLDSTLALLATCYAHDFLGISRKNIIGVTMPGFGTTGRTYHNALDLMKFLGVSWKEINIKEACLKHFEDIGHDPDNHNVVYENAQARERTQIAMDIANMENALVVGTGDMSELALGFTTYNGDHMSMYNVNCGIPKSLIRLLVGWIADSDFASADAGKILKDIILTPVSPELLPLDETGGLNQKTEEVVGPYEINDFFMYYMLNYGFSPEKIIFLAQQAFGDAYEKTYYAQQLKYFYKRFFTQQYKRSCAPDGPKTVEIGLSPRGDWRMPSDASYHIWIKEIDAYELRMEKNKNIPIA